MNITALKNFNAERLDLDELVGILADAKALRIEYESLQVEEPAFLDSTIKAIRREVNSRNSDKIAARKAELKARLDALKSPKEKAAELRKELEALQGVGA